MKFVLEDMMQERLINIEEVADLMSTSKSKAIETLIKYGLHGIDMGRGRGGGLRWLLSSVVAVMQTMAAEAKAGRKENPRKPKAPRLNLLSMSVDEIYALTTGQKVQ
ncbi:MAG: hypothetical protein K6G15_01405 [Desulfovibrio sp.]|nr:hypothetical protein [Desulfovibrio sp.]